MPYSVVKEPMYKDEKRTTGEIVETSDVSSNQISETKASFSIGPLTTLPGNDRWGKKDKQGEGGKTVQRKTVVGVVRYCSEEPSVDNIV